MLELIFAPTSLPTVGAKGEGDVSLLWLPRKPTPVEGPGLEVVIPELIRVFTVDTGALELMLATAEDALSSTSETKLERGKEETGRRAGEGEAWLAVDWDTILEG